MKNKQRSKQIGLTFAIGIILISAGSALLLTKRRLPAALMRR